MTHSPMGLLSAMGKFTVHNKDGSTTELGIFSGMGNPQSLGAMAYVGAMGKYNQYSPMGMISSFSGITIRVLELLVPAILVLAIPSAYFIGAAPVLLTLMYMVLTVLGMAAAVVLLFFVITSAFKR
jgi:hypothetical protein